jgi:hypothetical protein
MVGRQNLSCDIEVITCLAGKVKLKLGSGLYFRKVFFAGVLGIKHRYGRGT